MIEFNGEEYFDDRMFVLYLVEGVVREDPAGVVCATIDNETPPE